MITPCYVKIHQGFNYNKLEDNKLPDWKLYHKGFVDYDSVERVHRLTINFKIPVMFRDEVHPKGGSQVVIKPTKSGRIPQNQLTTVGNYSTVTDLARFRG